MRLDDIPIESTRVGAKDENGKTKPRVSWRPSVWSAHALISVSCFGCKGTLDAGRDADPLTTSTDVVAEPSGTTDSVVVTETDVPVDVSPMPSSSSVVDAGPGPSAPTPDLEMDASSPDGTPPLPPADAGTDAGTGMGDAGAEGPLPVSARNPILLINDNAYDSWMGELAALGANAGRFNVVGMVVNTSPYWPDIETNRAGWQEFIDAARASGLQNFPDIVLSTSASLVPPGNGNVDATVPNGSAGAQFIVEAALEYGTPELPLAVISGSTLTEVAEAYLMDPTVAERMVALASMGLQTDEGSVMGGPNGEHDPWASAIVARRLPLVQVNAYYEQVEDLPEARVPELPANPFGRWMADKRAGVDNAYAADQIALLAPALPGFATEVQRVEYAGLNGEGFPTLAFQEDGCCWLVTESDGSVAATFLWDMLQAPGTFLR